MKKVWTKGYDKGVPEVIDSNEYSSVADILEQTFKIRRPS